MKLIYIPPHSENEGSLADIATEPFADQKVDQHHDTCSIKEFLNLKSCE